MILCVCRVVRDADVDRAVAAGASTLDDIKFETGACTGCGTCEEAVCARLAFARGLQAMQPEPTGSQTVS